MGHPADAVEQGGKQQAEKQVEDHRNHQKDDRGFGVVQGVKSPADNFDNRKCRQPGGVPQQSPGYQLG